MCVTHIIQLKKEKIEEVAEYKVEIFCVADKMKKANPYEVLAYGVVKSEDV